MAEKFNNMIESECFDALRAEMINVLQAMRIEFKVMYNLMENNNRMSREDFVDDIIIARTLGNDIEVRLNKFVDKRKDACSLFTVIKDLEKTKRAKLTPTLKEIENRLDLFIKTEFKEKQTRRNETLAHLKKGKKFSYDEASVIFNDVKILLEIMDDLNTEKINYYYSYGKMEVEIDLRQQAGL